jgi:hypothetical protein
MIDRYTKVVLTLIAMNLTVITAEKIFKTALPEAQAQAQGVLSVRVVGGTLDIGNFPETIDVKVVGGTLDDITQTIDVRVLR